MMKKLLLILIRIYQYALSPLMGRNCRYYPGCSAYMKTSIERFGAARGIVLGTKRLCRCHPFTRGGYDPVPEEYPSKLSQSCGRTAARNQMEEPTA